MSHAKLSLFALLFFLVGSSALIAGKNDTVFTMKQVRKLISPTDDMEEYQEEENNETTTTEKRKIIKPEVKAEKYKKVYVKHFQKQELYYPKLLIKDAKAQAKKDPEEIQTKKFSWGRTKALIGFGTLCLGLPGLWFAYHEENVRHFLPLALTGGGLFVAGGLTAYKGANQVRKNWKPDNAKHLLERRQLKNVEVKDYFNKIYDKDAHKLFIARMSVVFNEKETDQASRWESDFSYGNK